MYDKRHNNITVSPCSVLSPKSKTAWAGFFQMLAGENTQQEQAEMVKPENSTAMQSVGHPCLIAPAEQQSLIVNSLFA